MRYIFGGLFILLGISLSNVLRGGLELAFYVLLLALIFIYNFKVNISLTALLLFFSSISIVLNPFYREVNLNILVYFLGPIIQGYLIAFCFYYALNIKTSEGLVSSLNYFVLMQFLVVLFMVAFPNLRLGIIDYIYGNQGYDSTGFTAALTFRGYGLTRHHLYAFPLSIAVVLGLNLLLKNYNRNALRDFFLKKLWLILVSSVICLLNARLGLMLIAVAVIIYFSSEKRNTFFISIITISLSFLLVNMDVTITSVFFNDYQSWLKESFNVFSFSEYKNNGTLNDLSSMIYFPEGLYSLMFGEGIVLNPNSSDVYSDIGIVRAIFSGGIFFFITILITYYSAFKNISTIDYQFRGAVNTPLFVFMFFGFIVAMIKGEAYSISDYSRMVFFLSFWGWFNYKRIASNV
ncbi:MULTISPECIES: hypothetical protein [Pectobacterium]|uniref:Wzy n=1 Tax=Pectobacterium carotovorum subsp. carotovorum (strain PC1) TaxID=561230 RepID=C6DCK4_PECCP|nr:hypothetical protein [Pectobacterium carotovorum]ACT12354.1 hypothetical protein PC1_1307 [Pectobacterium carotovorum subsp. carotovorum PC1]